MTSMGGSFAKHVEGFARARGASAAIEAISWATLLPTKPAPTSERDWTWKQGQGRDDMSRILRVSLIALSCTVLCGLGSVRGRGPDVTSPDSSAETQNPTTVSSNGTGGAPFERWKSCAQLVHPDGGYSASDLQARFERPENIQQMLQNLKSTGDQDWLLQPHFYDAETLLKLFNGSGVAWKERNPAPLSKNVEVIAVDIDSNIFPKMTLSVEADCWIMTHKYPDGHMEKTVSVGGNMRIYGSPVPGIPLRVIRSVLGPETENTIDTGANYDGPNYTPIYKGRVVYANRVKRQLEGTAIGTTFFFALGTLPKPGEPLPRKIVDDDVVKTIVMNASSHRILEK
jgi:hypothetical protein